MLPGRDRAPRIGYFRHEGLTQDTGGAFLDVDKQNAFAGTGVAVVLQPSDAIYRSLAARRRADAASALNRANIDATLLRAADAYFVLAESHAREAIARDDMRAAQELLWMLRGGSRSEYRAPHSWAAWLVAGEWR